jgi:streptogramin lyase
MRPDYLSPATRGILVKINGPTKVKKVAGLHVNAGGCHSKVMTVACTLLIPSLKSCPTKNPCYTATVATFDAYSGGRIPPGAHELSADQRFDFYIGSGTTEIPLTLEGIPQSIAFAPAAGSSLAGNATSGFVEPKCTAGVQTVNVTGADADGNYIVGVGAPKITLSSGNPTQQTVAKKGPNTFTLAPPAAPLYPFGGLAVPLAARAKPGIKSGGAAVTATFTVAYSGDICGVVDEFALPASLSEPLQIAAGPDGAVWFTEVVTNKIGRITPYGSISEFTVPTAASDPAGITLGPDGNLWFTETGGAHVGRITTAGAITEFPITAGTAPYYITSGPDGNLWFTEYAGNKIAKMTTTGILQEFAIPTSGSAPRGITSGPDGELWFAECSGGRIGQITTSGTIVEHGILGTTQPFGIAQGPDGRLWYAGRNGNVIAAMNSAGVVTSYFPLPAPNSYPAGIVAGPDGAMWFTEESGRIGRITVGGNLTEYPLSGGAATDDFGITVGSDGAIWFTETLNNKVGRIR